MRVSDQELIERFVAERGVTRIERPWPCKEVDGWSTQMGHAVAARKRGTDAMVRRRKIEGKERGERLWAQYQTNPCSEMITILAQQEKCTRGRILEIFRREGHGLGKPRAKKNDDAVCARQP